MKLIATNGCFEVLHAGHVDFLQRARALGDKLVVGLNVDDAVTALKGANRPLQSYPLRCGVLRALRCVDWVKPVKATDVVEFLLEHKPQVWVKGGDYTMDTLNPKEVRAAKEIGCEIGILPVVFNVHVSTLLALL